ncbi:DUF2063 domain-containing protein [Iodidimonas muriae]|uniref:DUF2063 domain-containing protein n=1 Tax=Iodidimonas muriae TaxID=261467 RepID=A0ABQ2LD14_9PROT|nr:DNA-binding domain-containing protein [Iodidimonas muriae]GER07195.1 DUF2063 domain-containing protein [Kordiimonadales bacterium JCM 17843]GGO11560.1 DUF2063 domain-containing protein [Iodidimonas muriae]
MPASPDKITLAGIQSAFADALSGRGDTALAPHIKPMPGVPTNVQLDIYRNNVHAALARSTEGLYPAVAKLVGEEFFHHMMRDYIQRFPPQHGRMVDYGHELPDFLESYPPVANLRYLADVARLELASYLAYRAPDHTPLNPAQLAGLSPQEVAALRFEFVPSLTLLASPWPVLDIYRLAMAPEGEEPPAPEMDNNPARLLILRSQDEVDMIPLPYGDFSFLMSLQTGANLEDAAAGATASQSDFDLSSTLAQAFSAGVFSTAR